MSFAVRERKTRGSITVEASIIVPVVILSIAAVIYMGLLLYQRAAIQSAAETAAEDGASAWSSGIAAICTGRMTKDSFDKIPLYRRIYDSGGNARLERIEEYAGSLAARGELLKPENTEIEAEIKNYAVCRKLTVTITVAYRLPMGRFLKRFGGSETFSIRVRGTAMLDEPAELIRNTDFILDLERELEKNNPGLKNLGDKTRNSMNSLKERLGNFLN